MSAVDAQLVDSIRGWLGGGPGARRLARVDRSGPRLLCAPGLADDPGVEAMARSLAYEVATVVVLEGAVPIGSDELEMLAELPAPAAGVVFALAGVDAEELAITERNRALLGAFTPGMEAAPMVPIRQGVALAAAVAAAEARLRGRDRVAEIAASALDFELARQRRRLGQVQRDPEFDRLRAGRAGLLRSRHGAHAPGEANGLPARLAAMRGAFGLARVDLGHEIAGRCRHLSTAVREELDAATKEGLRGFPHRLQDALATLDADLDRNIAGRLRSVAPASPAVRAAGGSPVLEQPRGRALAFEDRLMIVMGASAGLGLGRLLTAPLQFAGLPQALAAPIMLALGAVLAWWIVRARANLRDRQRMRQWAGDAIAEFKAERERMLAQRALDAEAAAVGVLGEEHARAVHEADRRLAELDARLSRLGREREDKVRAIKERLTQGARLRAALAPHVQGPANREENNNVDVR